MNFREQIEEVKPREIEERSFAIISEELGARTFAPHTELIVKRCIHTSADFDYADNLCFSQDAAVKAMEAIQRGVSVVTDTNAISNIAFPCGSSVGQRIVGHANQRELHARGCPHRGNREKQAVRTGW